jgi:hypothetical protein
MATLIVVTLTLIFVLAMILHGLFLRRLRREYPEVWESLGRPTLIINNSPRNSLASLKYLFAAQYRELPDDGFVRYCDFLRMFDLVYGIVFGAWLLINVLGIFVVH